MNMLSILDIKGDDKRHFEVVLRGLYAESHVDKDRLPTISKYAFIHIVHRKILLSIKY